MKCILQFSHVETALIHQTFGSVVWSQMIKPLYTKQCKRSCTEKEKAGMLIFSKHIYDKSSLNICHWWLQMCCIIILPIIPLIKIEKEQNYSLGGKRSYTLGKLMGKSNNRLESIKKRRVCSKKLPSVTCWRILLGYSVTRVDLLCWYLLLKQLHTWKYQTVHVSKVFLHQKLS